MMLEFVMSRRGWRHPLDTTSECEVWCGLKLVGILPAALLCQVLEQFVSTVLLSMAASQQLDLTAVPTELRFPLISMAPRKASPASRPRLVGVRRPLRGWARNVTEPVGPADRSRALAYNPRVGHT